jgi:phage shock protein C
MADRLYRSRTDRMLAGVAGGVAESLDVDPSLVRVAWALLAIFTGGIALVAYIVMAIVVPEEPGSWTSPWPTASPPVQPAPPAGSAPSAAATDAAGAAVSEPTTPAAASTEPAATAAAGETWAPGPPPPPPQSYWASDRDARRAARRARREYSDSSRGGLVFGIILIAIGAIFLVREFLPWFDWHIWWPVGLIALGVVLLLLAIVPRRSSD